MKNINLIVIASFLAVIICLIMSLLLFYSVTPTSLIIVSFTIGFISGVCVTLLIHNLINIFKSKRLKNEQTKSRN
jgi:multisubunit Na+/H+ antiporter MnhE subunit